MIQPNGKAHHIGKFDGKRRDGQGKPDKGPRAQCSELRDSRKLLNWFKKGR